MACTGWRGEAWAWAGAMFLAVTLLTGMALLALLGLWTAPYALVVVVALALAASLLPTSVRRMLGS